MAGKTVVVSVRADWVLAMTDMATDGKIDRALAAVTATINDQQLERFDRDRVQEVVNQTLGGEPLLTVDDGGGLHDRSGARLGAIRRTPSGEWVTERQNEKARRSDTAVPTKPPQRKLRRVLTRLKLLGG